MAMAITDVFPFKNDGIGASLGKGCGLAVNDSTAKDGPISCGHRLVPRTTVQQQSGWTVTNVVLTAGAASQQKWVARSSREWEHFADYNNEGG